MNIHNNILETIKREKVVTSSEIAKLFKINWNTAEKYLLELVIDGKITKIKKLGVNLWTLK
jgi:predicted HTH transcriptional regulator